MEIRRILKKKKKKKKLRQFVMDFIVDTEPRTALSLWDNLVNELNDSLKASLRKSRRTHDLLFNVSGNED